MTAPSAAALSSCQVLVDARLRCGPSLASHRASRPSARTVVCSAEPDRTSIPATRREIVLQSVNVGFLATLFTWGESPRPQNLGVGDYGGGVKSLALCPSTPNCIATSEFANDPDHYVPPFLYNPEDGRGRKKPVTQAQAMEELASVVGTIKPDNFEPTVITKTSDYLYAEFKSPTFGFTDDVEFWFPSDKPGLVEYRSASRMGDTDFDINRKRIKAIREELQKKGWASYGI